MNTETIKLSIKHLVETLLLIGLVYIASKYIHIRIAKFPSNEWVYSGPTVIIILALGLGSKKAAIAGAFGMALFHITSGWTSLAPYTFIITGLMGFSIGKIAYAKGREGNSIILNIFAVIIGIIIMIAGYYISNVILHENWIIPLSYIPEYLPQNIVGLIIGVPFGKLLKDIINIFDD